MPKKGGKVDKSTKTDGKSTKPKVKGDVLGKLTDQQLDDVSGGLMSSPVTRGGLGYTKKTQTYDPTTVDGCCGCM